MSESITYLHIRAINACSSSAILQIGQNHFPCLIGKSGRRHLKREGDGATPIGRWRVTELRYRPDRVRGLSSKIPTRPMKPNDGWCDAVAHRSYNRSISLPFAGGHEKLWREDHAYDIVGMTDHNQRPRVRGLGSAIFFHVINEGATGTEGCVALSKHHLKLVLQRISKKTYLVI